MAHQTIALLSDFGLDDNYVGVMKCVIQEICPGGQILDLCHNVPPQNILSGSYLLASAAPFLPDDCVVVGVVDPGVGSHRRSIAVDFGDFTCVGPDNGLFDMIRKKHPAERAFELSNPEFHLEEVSTTFHGRDVFSPVGAHLAAGRNIEDVGEEVDIDDLVRLPPSAPFFREDRIECHIIHVDRYGNLITNLSDEEMDEWLDGAKPVVEIADKTLDLDDTFSEVPPGRPLAYFGSASQLEIAVREGDAARQFKTGQNKTVFVKRKADAD